MNVVRETGRIRKDMSDATQQRTLLRPTPIAAERNNLLKRPHAVCRRSIMSAPAGRHGRASRAAAAAFNARLPC
ncbi:hypothetical protein BVIET440_20062 [Burkholderia vietnamiensis]